MRLGLAGLWRSISWRSSPSVSWVFARVILALAQDAWRSICLIDRLLNHGKRQFVVLVLGERRKKLGVLNDREDPAELLMQLRDSSQGITSRKTCRLADEGRDVKRCAAAA